ncbi:MAG: four helix bundle protein [Patescibacteria group bacterium]
MNKIKRKFDLEERTAKFGESVIDLLKAVRRDEITKPIITQLVKSATSVGANYCEADDAESKKDFKHKIGICKKEARESKHFLRMLARAAPELKDQIREHWQEVKELHLIFNSIYRKIDISGVSF